MDNNYRSPILLAPEINSAPQQIMRTPLGNIQSTQQNYGPPALPPSPMQMQQYSNYGSSYGQFPYSGYGGLGNFGSSGLFGGGGYGMGAMGMGGYGGFGSYNRYGCSNAYDPETRFIQMAEESSRPALQSIESLVSVVANFAAMLDSTFFAITSSFRAILGVAANFSRLRGIFSQFWQTFAIFRGLTWIYRKFLYWLKITNVDPSTMKLSEAFEQAQIHGSNGAKSFHKNPKTQSHWPVVAFIGFICAAPYLVMKLLSNLTTTVIEETKDPRHWIKPIKSKVMYDFEARNDCELTIAQGQQIYIAPKEIQHSQKLLNTGWALATLDGITSGIIPLTYVQKVNVISKPNNVEIMTMNDNSVRNVFANSPELPKIGQEITESIKPNINDNSISDNLNPNPIGPENISQIDEN